MARPLHSEERRGAWTIYIYAPTRRRYPEWLAVASAPRRRPLWCRAETEEQARAGILALLEESNGAV